MVAEATKEWILKAVQELKTARQNLFYKPVYEIVNALDRVAQNWLNPEDPIRKKAECLLPEMTGYSPAMIQKAIQDTYCRLRKWELRRLLWDELREGEFLNQFWLYERGGREIQRVRARASGPDVILHILSGNIPGVGIPQIVYGLLAKSGNLVKVPSEEPAMAELFVKSLYQVDETLAACVKVTSWKGGNREIEETAFSSVSIVVATGNDETLSDIQSRIPYPVRFVPYGHKISFGIIGKEALTLNGLNRLHQRVALDVSLYDQQGCLSPHQFFVEEGGKLAHREFILRLLESLKEMENTFPPRALSVGENAQRRIFLSRFEFHPGGEIFLTPSGQSAIIFLPTVRLHLSCLNRVVFIVPFSNVSQVLDAVRDYAGKISTVSAAMTTGRLRALSESLHLLRVSRICPVGRMQLPSPVWHHDNRPSFSDFLLWTDVDSERR